VSGRRPNLIFADAAQGAALSDAPMHDYASKRDSASRAGDTAGCPREDETLHLLGANEVIEAFDMAHAMSAVLRSKPALPDA
jgi:hypothetical protein